jgi:hypothetical protein
MIGCPDCATARVVRASVFDGDFCAHLAMISLPLLAMGLISALVYRIGREQPEGDAHATTTEDARP